MHYALDNAKELADRIVAVVNEHVITLTDLKIADRFGIYDEELKDGEDNRFPLILEIMVNQKVVIDATREEMFLDEELESELQRIALKFGPEEFEKRLAEFGLSRMDLMKEYLKDKILYQKILSQRFGRGVIVSLEEILSFYQEKYLPSQERKGLQPRTMMEVLDEIESQIRQEKMRAQVVDWVDNLKKKAEVEIKLDVLSEQKK